MSGRISEMTERIGDRESLLGCVALGVLLFRLGKDHPTFDKKLLRQLLELHTQVLIGTPSVLSHTLDGKFCLT